MNGSFDRLIERIGFRSNWLRFSQDSRPHFRRKFSWRHQVDWNAQQFFQFHLQSAQIKQGRARQRINQKIEIAAVSIFTAGDRAKHAWIGRSKMLCELIDLFAVRAKRGRRFHSEFPKIQRPGTPIATGRIIDPAAPFSSSGRIMVHEVHTWRLR